LIESSMIVLLSVPEGLPMCLTLSLAIAVHIMKGKNIVVQKLTSSYVMGGVNELIIDKTGTVTEN